MFVTLIPCTATGIDIRKEGTVQHGGARMPSITRVVADYENGVVTLKVTRYTGGIQVYVYDSNGSVVAYDYSALYGSSTLSINVGNLPEADYTLSIVLDNATYCGEFHV